MIVCIVSASSSIYTSVMQSLGLRTGYSFVPSCSFRPNPLDLKQVYPAEGNMQPRTTGEVCLLSSSLMKGKENALLCAQCTIISCRIPWSHISTASLGLILEVNLTLVCEYVACSITRSLFVFRNEWNTIDITVWIKVHGDHLRHLHSLCPYTKRDLTLTKNQMIVVLVLAVTSRLVER